MAAIARVHATSNYWKVTDSLWYRNVLRNNCLDCIIKSEFFNCLTHGTVLVIVVDTEHVKQYLSGSNAPKEKVKAYAMLGRRNKELKPCSLICM